MIVSNKTDVCNDAWTTVKAYLYWVSPSWKTQRLVTSVERETERGRERERGVKLCHMTGDEGDALSSWEQRDLPLKHLISNCEFTQMQGMVIVFLIKQCWDVLVRFVKKLNKKLKEIEGKLQRKQVWERLYRNIQHSSVGAICWLKFTSLQHPLQLHTHLK